MILPLALTALALATPGTLVYETGNAKPFVNVAGADGSGARRLTAGSFPHISRDGQAVVYVKGDNPQLREIATAGGPSRLLARGFRYGTFAWSPDGRYVAAEVGPLNGAGRLVLIDRTTRTTRTVARGAFYGASFSPDGTQVVYSHAHGSQLFPRADLEVAAVAGGLPRVLTNDLHSVYPVWGPQRIAYVRWKRPARRQDGPKFNLWLIAPDGTGRRQLTHDKVPFLLSGLTPTAWSDDGTKLLAQFGGQDNTWAVTVDPATGRERRVVPRANGIFGTAISRDGTEILAARGGFEFGGRSEVVAYPYAGGAARVIARGSFPDWTG